MDCMIREKGEIRMQTRSHRRVFGQLCCECKGEDNGSGCDCGSGKTM